MAPIFFPTSLLESNLRRAKNNRAILESSDFFWKKHISKVTFFGRHWHSLLLVAKRGEEAGREMVQTPC